MNKIETSMSCPDCGSEFQNPEQKKPDIVEHPYFRLDRRTMRVFAEGQDIGLSRTEYEIFDYLVAASGDVVTKIQIEEQIWNDPNGGTNQPKLYVWYIREKFKAVGGQDPIELSYGRGYRLKTKEDVIEEQALESLNSNGHQPQIGSRVIAPSHALAFQADNPAESSNDNDASSL